LRKTFSQDVEFIVQRFGLAFLGGIGLPFGGGRINERFARVSRGR
jgi:hypothetical protein